jgi:large subunit ribosomal protein L15
MQLNQIPQTNKQKTKKRVGRGGKRGTFSGHGVKGQKSRAGAKIRPAWRDLVKQTPKKRGYKFKPASRNLKIINLGVLDNFFKDGEAVSIRLLLDRKLIGKMDGRLPKVKILGGGELKKRLSFVGLALSGSARKKIEKAGGSIL